MFLLMDGGVGSSGIVVILVVACVVLLINEAFAIDGSDVC